MCNHAQFHPVYLSHGEFEVYLDADRSQPIPVIRRIGMLHTALMIFDGVAYAHANYQPRLT